VSEDQLQAVVAAGMPGAVAVGPGFAGAAGVANIDTGEPLTTEHRFRIGSVTKIFVAALILQLVAEGAFNLDDDAGPLVEGVTIKQLLNHTSGLPDFQDDMVALFEPYREDPDYRWLLRPREQLALVLEKPRLFAPGEGWAYHGSNYLALGLLVEDTTGSKLGDELRSRIFEPLGLAATRLVDGPLTGDRCARGYLPPDNPVLPGSGSGLVDVTELDLPFYWAGGGIVSTAGDVAAMLAALLGGDLLPDELRVEMLEAVESDWAETDRYGLGIGEISAAMGRERSPCGPAWGHVGFSAGYTAIAIASEDGSRQVVVMANGQVTSQDTWDASWDAVGRLLWDAYCK
jgi:D-alanyl-D-alanine carboxypeptidase